ncbi:hypothetical protein [Treponema sp.]|uniref:hypothetical protein n=1 Tax=Treponema sp. TaxID=166 RepID=UPI0038909491
MEKEISHVAEVIISIVPIVGITFAAIIVFFALLWRHRENKLKIMNGTFKETTFNLEIFSLFTGLCLFGVGAVITGMFLLLKPNSFGILGGLVPLALGITLLVFYKVCPKK